MRNSQRHNGYGKSGVNKKIRRAGTGVSRKSLLSVPPSELLGFIPLPLILSGCIIRTFILKNRAASVTLSLCESSSIWIPPSNIQNGERGREGKKRLGWKSLACPLLQTRPVEVLSRKAAATFNNQTCVTVHFLSWIRSAMAPKCEQSDSKAEQRQNVTIGWQRCRHFTTRGTVARISDY